MFVKVQECRILGEEGSEERNKGPSWSEMVANTGSHGLIVGCRHEHVPHPNTCCSTLKNILIKPVCACIFSFQKNGYVIDLGVLKSLFLYN